MTTNFAQFGSTQIDPRVAGAGPIPDVPEGQVSIGLRGGADSALSNLNAFAASGARALGANDFAAGRQAAANSYAQDAATADNSLRVNKFANVHSLRDFGDYAAGQFGQLLPSVGGGVAAGIAGGLVGGPIGALAAGTAAFTPIEAGGLAMRDQANPVAQKRSAGDNFLRELGGGAAASLAQNIVPAAFGGKLIGAAAERAASRSLGHSLLANGVEGVVGQGAAGAGAEAIRQQAVDPNAPFDTGAIKEAGLANAAVGLPLSGVGVAGDMLHGAPRAVAPIDPNAAPGILATAKGLATNSVAAVKDAATTGFGAAKDAATTAAGAVREATAGATPPEVLKQWGDQITSAIQPVAGSIGERAAGAVAAGKRILDDPNAPAEIKAQAKAALTNAGDKTNQAWLAATDKTRDFFTKPAEAAPAPADPLAGLQEASQPIDDAAQRIAAGHPLGDLDALANTPPGPELNSMVQSGIKKTTDTLTGWGNSLMQRADVPPEQRAQIADAMSNLSDSASKKLIATTQMAMNAKDKILNAADNASKSMTQRFADKITGAADGTKQSADTSGLRATIAQELIPHLPREIMQDPAAAAKVVSTIQQFIHAAGSEDFMHVQSIADNLRTVLGENSDDILAKVYHAVGSEDPAAINRFGQALDQSRTLGFRQKSVQDVIAKALPQGSGIDPAQLTQHLVSWARGDGPANEGKGQFYHQAVRGQIEKLFGEKAPVIYKRLEQEANETKQRTTFSGDDMDTSTAEAGGSVRANIDDEVSKPTRDAPAGALQAGMTDRQYFGGGADPTAMKPLNSPARHAASYEAAMAKATTDEDRIKLNPTSAAEKAMAALQEKHPTKNVSFVSEADYNREHGIDGGATDKGFLKVEGVDNGALKDADLKAMRLDTKKYAKSVSRLDVPVEAGVTHSFDAVKLAKHFAKFTDGGGLTEATRSARGFLEGVSALTDKYGKFDIPDETVIGKSGGQDLTFADAKKLDVRTYADRRRDALRRGSDEIVQEFKNSTDPEEKAALRDEYAGIQKDLNGPKNAELTKEHDSTPSTGEVNPSKDGQIHEAASKMSADELVNRSNMDGSGQHVSNRPAIANRKPLMQLDANLRMADTPIATKVANRLDALVRNSDMMSRQDSAKLQRLHAMSSASEVAEVINPLARKYKDQIVPPKGMERGATRSSDGGTSPEEMQLAATAKSGVALKNKTTMDNGAVLDKALATENYDGLDLTKADVQKRFDELRALDRSTEDGLKGQQLDAYARAMSLLRDPTTDWKSFKADFGPDEGSTPSPKAVAAKKAALTERALSGDKSLIEHLQTSDDAKGLQRAAEHLAQTAPHTEALRAVNDRLDHLVQDADTAYGMLTKKYSLDSTKATGEPIAVADRVAVGAYIDRVLGGTVASEFKKMAHAGEFELGKQGARDILRVSTTALDPLGTAHHEALHALFKQLRAAGSHDILGVLEKAGNSSIIRNQLEKAFANNPEVLKQLSDPEERAAYMYQLHSAGKLNVGPAVKGVFTRIGDFVRGMLGMWSNDQRAQHIMDYFDSGEYAKKMGNQRLVHDDLMNPGRNSAVEALKGMAQPITKLGDAVFGTGAARVRDADNTHLNKIADLVKPDLTARAGDPGYIAASRIEHSAQINRLGEALGKYTPDQLREALESLQSGKKATSLEARTVSMIVKKSLRDTYDYMDKAGAKVNDLGGDYFPRVWDANYVSSHQTEIRKMLDKYVQSGDLKGDPEKIISRLISNDGAEFDIDQRTALGMAAAKERVLSFISHEDAAPFLEKDLLRTMNGYISQASRRAEWARRFGGDGSKLETLLENAAKSGATREQIATTEKYLKGVTRTLGEGLNPTARRLMGNMVVYQNIRLLPLAIFSSIPDSLGIVVRGGTVSDAFSAFKRGIAEMPKNFRKGGGPSDAQTNLAATLGVIDNAVLTHALGSLYSQGMIGDHARTANNAFFKYNFMEQYNTSMRVGATQAALKFIQRHADGVNEHSERYLSELGLKASDVKMKNGELALTEADGLDAAHANKMRAAVNRWVDGAVLRPDAADKPIYFNDPHFMLVSHLKQFVFSFQKTILGRVVHEAQHGNYTPAMALASYVPMMIAADYLKGMVQGGGDEPSWKKNWGPGDYVSNGVQRSGLLGVGQFGVDAVGDIREGGSGLGTLVGPTIEQFIESIKTAGGSERFGTMALHAMPANALYSHAFQGGGQPDPKFAD